jgi:hypothetical protein
MWNIFTAGVVGMTIGLSWSEIVFRSYYSDIQSNGILSDDEECEYYSATGFKCLQKTKQTVDPVDNPNDFEKNTILTSYRYLTSMFQQDTDYLMSQVKKDYNMLKKGINSVESSISDISSLFKTKQNYLVNLNTTTTDVSYSSSSETDTVTDPSSCFSLCSNGMTNKCKSTLYDDTTNKCSLFSSSDRTKLKTKTNNAFIEKISPYYVYLPNATYADATNENNSLNIVTNITDYNDCYTQCENNPSCVGFEYDSSLNQCQMRKNLSQAGPTTVNTSNKSFFIINTDISNNPNYELFPGVRFIGGNNVTKKNVTNPVDCLVDCSTNYVGFSYNTDSQTCLMYNKSFYYDAAVLDPSYNSYMLLNKNPNAFKYIKTAKSVAIPTTAAAKKTR